MQSRVEMFRRPSGGPDLAVRGQVDNTTYYKELGVAKGSGAGASTGYHTAPQRVTSGHAVSVGAIIPIQGHRESEGRGRDRVAPSSERVGSE